MSEWNEYEPEDDPVLEGIPTDWSIFLAAFAVICALAGIAIYKLWVWLF